MEQSLPHMEAGRGSGAAIKRVDAERLPPPVEVSKGVDVERQPPAPNGRAPGTEGRRICETGSVKGTL